MDRYNFSIENVKQYFSLLFNILRNTTKQNEKDTYFSMIFEFLTYKSGRIFLKKFKDFTIVSLEKAISIMLEIKDSENEVRINFRKNISRFLSVNKDIFYQHSLDFILYIGTENTINITSNKNIDCLNEIEKQMIKCKEKNKKYLIMLIKSEIEKGNIEPYKPFKCDYKLAEIITCKKITDDIIKEVGCDVKMEVDNINNILNVNIFNEYSYDFKIKNIYSIIIELKNELNNSLINNLYNIGFCRDISILISSFIY